jgi:hypothetical protein
MRYWLEAEGDATRVVAVSDEAVYAESLQGDRLQAVETALRDGQSPARAFSDKATHVVLRDATRVQLSTADDDIDFSLGSGKQAKTVSLRIDDAGLRDEVFAEIEQVTDGRLRRYEDRLSRPRAAFASLMALTVFGLLTVVGARAAAAVQAADEIEVSGRKQGIKYLVLGALDLLGPLGIGILGGLICALCLATLVMRLRQPPRLQILQARPYRPQGGVLTCIKYAVLLGIWVLFVPPLLF